MTNNVSTRNALLPPVADPGLWGQVGIKPHVVPVLRGLGVGGWGLGVGGWGLGVGGWGLEVGGMGLGGWLIYQVCGPPSTNRSISRSLNEIKTVMNQS